MPIACRCAASVDMTHLCVCVYLVHYLFLVLVIEVLPPLLISDPVV